MKRFTAKFFSFCCVLILLAGMMVSCIKEDLDHCPSTIDLTFSYEHNPEFTDLFKSNVDRVWLYVYDKNNHYVSDGEASVSTMHNRNTMCLRLKSGNYRIVVWGNTDDREFEIVGGRGRPYDDSRLSVITDANGCVADNTTDLFHGIIHLKVQNNTMVRDTVSMIRNTNDISVVIEGLENLPDSPYDVRIEGCNGDYNFSNDRLAGSPAVTYLPRYTSSTFENMSYSSADFKVMRLQTDSDLTLNITEGTVVRLSEELIPLLQKTFPLIKNNEDLDRYHEYTFVYRFTPSDPNDTFTFIRVLTGPWDAVTGGSGGI